MPGDRPSRTDLVILGAVLALCAVMWLATQGREARAGACVAAAAALAAQTGWQPPQAELNRAECRDGPSGTEVRWTGQGPWQVAPVRLQF